MEFDISKLLSESTKRAKELGLGPSGAPIIRLPESTGIWWDRLWGNITGREYDKFWQEILDHDYGRAEMADSKLEHDLERIPDSIWFENGQDPFK